MRFTILTGAYHCRQNELPAWHDVLSVIWSIALLNHYSFISVHVEPAEGMYEKEIGEVLFFLRIHNLRK